MVTVFKKKAAKIVSKLNEKVRKEVLNHTDDFKVIAKKAGMTPEALSTFTCGHSELCHTNLIAVWFAIDRQYHELVND